VSVPVFVGMKDIHLKHKDKYPDHLADSCKRSSVNRMAAGSSHGFFSSFTYFSNMLCAVKLRVLGLIAYCIQALPSTRYPNHNLNSSHKVSIRVDVEKLLKIHC